jgi:hypothetical protein
MLVGRTSADPLLDMPGNLVVVVVQTGQDDGRGDAIGERWRLHQTG